MLRAHFSPMQCCSYSGFSYYCSQVTIAITAAVTARATDSQVNFALYARACTLLYGLNAISFRTNGMLEQLYSKSGFSGYGSFATTARKLARGRISASRLAGLLRYVWRPLRRVCKAVGCQNGSHAVAAPALANQRSMHTRTRDAPLQVKSLLV